MTTVTLERSINASPDAAWAALRGFGFPYFKGFQYKLEGEGVGTTRAFEMPNGPMSEKVVAFDDAGRTLSWEILTNPWPVKDYRATVAVTPDGEGAKVTFSAQFTPDGAVEEEASKIVAGTFNLNLKSLDRYLAADG